MFSVISNKLKSYRLEIQKHRHHIYILRNRFARCNSKNEFQPNMTGVFGYWFYIIIEETLTLIINSFLKLEDCLHKS